ncbi:MAG: hypothetical protein ACK4NY_04935 [Spirosomataceae bacterium]
MEFSTRFINIIKPVDGKLFKGVNLGDSIQKAIESDGHKFYESTDVVTFIRYYFKIDSTKESEYKVVYYYDNNRMIEVISLVIEFEVGLSHSITIEEYDSLMSEFDDYLKANYGEPNTETKNIKGNGKEIHNTWIINTEQPIQVSQIFYSKPEESIKKAMKLEFQYYYE